MKSIKKLVGILICMALIISSCSKGDKQVNMIPKNALVVVHLNTKSVMSKLSWDEVRQTNWFKELYSDTAVKSWTKKLMDNPANTGIDFSAGVIIFMQKQAGTRGEIVFEGEIKDAATFEAFNKNFDENAKTAKDGDINMVVLKDQAVAGWNDKKFAYVFNPERFVHKVDYDESMGTAPTVSATQNLSAVCKKLFALNPDSSMAKVEKFSSLLKEDGDVHVWQNNEEIARSSMQMGMLGMMNLDLLIKGNITTSTGNFDKGKITIDQKFYASTELTDLLKKYSGGNINADIIKNIPSQNINGILTIHFKPEGLKELIKLTGMDGFVNIYLAKKGITLDDFVKANKGDIMFAVTDFLFKKDSGNTAAEGAINYSPARPDVNFLFSVSIGDKPSFNKLMAAGKMLEGEMGGNMGFSAASNDKFFAIGNSRQNVSKYISGSDNKFDFIDKFSEHPVTLFVDIQKLLTTTAPEASKDSGANIIMQESIKMWQNIYAMGGEYKGDAFVLNVEINLVDKTTNSLKQLNGYFDKISKVIIEKDKREKEDWGKDSLAIPSLDQIDTATPSFKFFSF